MPAICEIPGIVLYNSILPGICFISIALKVSVILLNTCFLQLLEIVLAVFWKFFELI